MAAEEEAAEEKVKVKRRKRKGVFNRINPPKRSRAGVGVTTSKAKDDDEDGSDEEGDDDKKEDKEEDKEEAGEKEDEAEAAEEGDEDGVMAEVAGMRLHLSTRCATGYRGVYPSAGRFKAKHKATHLGHFDTAVEAAVAYANHVRSLDAPDAGASVEVKAEASASAAAPASSSTMPAPVRPSAARPPAFHGKGKQTTAAETAWMEESQQRKAERSRSWKAADALAKGAWAAYGRTCRYGTPPSGQMDSETFHLARLLQLLSSADCKVDGKEVLMAILLEGLRVEMHGLVKKSELNGVTGVIRRAKRMEPGRFRVQIDGGKLLALRPENVRVLPADSKDGGAAGPSAEAADEFVQEAAEHGCVWYSRVRSKTGQAELEKALDATKFSELLEHGHAFALPPPTATAYWNLGELEEEIKRASVVGDKHGPFLRLAELLGPLECRMQMQIGSDEQRVPGQGSSDRKHTMRTWLEQVDPSLPRRPEVPDKLLHWPVGQSPRIEKLLKLPSWLNQANWLADRQLCPGCKEVDTKLQLVHAHQKTPYHRDNGGKDTWMKLLVGQVLVACWSQDDGEAYGLHDNMLDYASDERANVPLDWACFRCMPSARLFLLEQGEVLVMPCGTYHYVYTSQRKIVVASDFLNDAGWERRRQCLERDCKISVGNKSFDKTTDLDGIKKRWVQREERHANGEPDTSRATSRTGDSRTNSRAS